MGNNFYVVYEGARVDRPTIFSSWGDAHPRVTGCDARYKGFASLDKSRESLKAQGYEEGHWDEVIKSPGENTEPLRRTRAFHAVANGESIGVHCFSGKNGCQCQVDEVSGACHKHFETKDQADDFIKDWKESVARIYYQAIRKALDDGKRPCDMSFDISGLRLLQVAKMEDTLHVGSQLEQLKLE